MRRLVVCLVTTWMLLVSATAQARDLPVQITGPGLVVRAEAGLDRMARRVVDIAGPALVRIRADLRDLPSPGHIEVRLVHQAEDLAAVAPAGRGAPHWAVGVAYPDLGVISVAMNRGAEILDAESTTVHELAHMALGAALRGRVPRWLNEGFAYLHSSDISLERTRTLIGMAWGGDVIPLAHLDRSFPAEERSAHRAYAQSYDMVAFMARRGRYSDPDDDGDRWAMRVFLASLAKGSNVEQASHIAFGVPIEKLFAEWYEDMRSRYLTAPMGMVGLAVWVLGAVLLVLGFMRRRRQKRLRLAEWEREEGAAAAAAAAAALV